MGPKLTLLTPADYVTTQWSGGTTTQLTIAPAGAVYAERSFLWRVSSATVELDESDFTALPDYRRFISTLRGEMTLTHNGGAALTLRPGEVHAFDGADDTHSRGRCTDFNLMLRKGRADGALRSFRCDGGALALACDAMTQCALVYCAQGAGTLSCLAQSQALRAGESVLLEGLTGEDLRFESADSALLFLAEMREEV